MKHVLMLIPATTFVLVLATGMASAAGFGKLPKYGPIPEMRPIHISQSSAKSGANIAAEAACQTECDPSDAKFGSGL